jgi:hypothetical protein
MNIPHPIQQHLSYAFFIHSLGSLILVMALFCSIVAAHLLLAKECRKIWWRRKMKGKDAKIGEKEDKLEWLRRF